MIKTARAKGRLTVRVHCSAMTTRTTPSSTSGQRKITVAPPCCMPTSPYPRAGLGPIHSGLDGWTGRQIRPFSLRRTALATRPCSRRAQHRCLHAAEAPQQAVAWRPWAGMLLAMTRHDEGRDRGAAMQEILRELELRREQARLGGGQIGRAHV